MPLSITTVPAEPTGQTVATKNLTHTKEMVPLMVLISKIILNRINTGKHFQLKSCTTLTMLLSTYYQPRSVEIVNGSLNCPSVHSVGSVRSIPFKFKSFLVR